MNRPVRTLHLAGIAALFLAALAADTARTARLEQEPDAQKQATGDQPDPRLAELDALWAEVDRAVREGDFEAYAARCHPEGVLVSESKGLSQPLSKALARWKPEFAATREGRMTAEVETRFTRRLGDVSTAHESGMFRYTSRTEGKESQTDFVPFDALLVKRDGRWLILMEHQKAHATRAEWEKLATGARAASSREP